MSLQGRPLLAAGLIVGLVFAYLAWQVRDLRREVGTRVPAVTRTDLDLLEGKLRQGVAAEIRREVAGAEERLTLAVAASGERILRRVVTRPGTAGPPGQPGAPGTPGQPLIPPGAADSARARAVARILVGFDSGHLIGCPTPGIPPDTVELLRDPSGRLGSTAPCVASVDEESRLAPSAPPARARSRWKIVGVAGSGGADVGAGYTVLRVWRLDGDAIATVGGRVGFGASYRATDNFSVGPAYLCRPSAGEGCGVFAYFGWGF